MPKKHTLFSYSKRQVEAKKGSDTEVVAFLKSVKPGSMLMLSAGEESVFANDNGFSVTVFDDDLEAIQNLKLLTNQISFEYGVFFTFAKRIKKSQFEYIIDNCFSNRLRRSDLKRFYNALAKMLSTNGTLLTRVSSTEDPYCREHCPERTWTYIKDRYYNYFQRPHLIQLLRSAGFGDESYSNENTGAKVYHVVRSRLKNTKL